MADMHTIMLACGVASAAVSAGCGARALVEDTKCKLRRVGGQLRTAFPAANPPDARMDELLAKLDKVPANPAE